MSVIAVSERMTMDPGTHTHSNVAPLRFTGVWMWTGVHTESAERLLGRHPTESHVVTLTFEALGAALVTCRPGLVALDLARTTSPAAGDCFTALAWLTRSTQSGGQHHGRHAQCSAPILISRLNIRSPFTSEKSGMMRLTRMGMEKIRKLRATELAIRSGVRLGGDGATPNWPLPIRISTRLARFAPN
jgi:hypothetical protein